MTRCAKSHIVGKNSMVFDWTETDFLYQSAFVALRQPGIEPGLRPWEGRIIPLDHCRISEGD